MQHGTYPTIIQQDVQKSGYDGLRKMNSKYRDTIVVHPNEFTRKLSDEVGETRRVK